MKIKALLISLFLVNASLAQTDIAYAPQKADTSILKYKITILENIVNNKNEYSERQIINLIEKSYFQQLKNKEGKSNQVDYQKVFIQIKEIITDSINAKVFCEYIFYDDNSISEPVFGVILLTHLTQKSRKSLDF